MYIHTDTHKHTHINIYRPPALHRPPPHTHIFREKEEIAILDYLPVSFRKDENKMQHIL